MYNLTFIIYFDRQFILVADVLPIHNYSKWHLYLLKNDLQHGSNKYTGFAAENIIFSIEGLQKKSLVSCFCNLTLFNL